MRYEEVKNPRKRAEEYRDSEPISLAFVFLEEKWHDAAVKWCKKNWVEHHTFPYKEGKVSLVTTSFHRESADRVFEELGHLSPNVVTTASIKWVDIK